LYGIPYNSGSVPLGQSGAPAPADDSFHELARSGMSAL
jgi:hypothetical protein